MNIALLAVVLTFYLFLTLLCLWWAVQEISRDIDASVRKMRDERNQDLRTHHDSLLAHIRLDDARRK